MKGRLLGIIILVVIVAAALVYQFALRKGPDNGGVLNDRAAVVSGSVGSEKIAFLDNEEVRRILATRYDLEIEIRAGGSIESTSSTSKTSADFLWPSSQVAALLFGLRENEPVRSETIFSSPVVFYTWDEVATALIAAGTIQEGEDGYLEAPVASLAELILEETTWSDIGIDSLYGSVAIATADPAQSGSGTLFAGLVANALDEGVVSEGSLNKVMGRVIRVFEAQGTMESSSRSLFDNYVEQGIGPFPIIVGYENQIIEYARQSPDLWPGAQEQMRVIYPVPTVFCEHRLIAMTELGERLIEALKDEEIQQIAWDQHGFRTALENDPAALGLTGMPATVTRVTRMPVAEVMQTIVTALQ
jgi:hypothetical protein